MKSMVHEASSVVKAIQKAWEAAGMPKEFTIKVLQLEERGILWFSKEPAVVSICYHEPRKHSTPDKKDEKHHWRTSNGAGTARKNKPAFQEDRQSHHNKRGPRLPAKTMPRAEDNNRTSENNPSDVGRQAQASEQAGEDVAKWAENYTSDIVAWAEEIGSIMVGSPIKVAPSVDGVTLRVVFEKPLVSDLQQQQIAAQSLQTLLLQFLKKKYKKRFRGLHLVVDFAK